jgi:hypothetical protein
VDEKRIQQYCNELTRKIHEGAIDENTIYVVHLSHWHLFKRNAPKIVCGRVQASAYIVCVSAQRPNAFRDFLVAHEFSPTPLTLSLNGPSFGLGDTLILTATLDPGLSPQPVDCYITLQRPYGRVVFLQTDGGFTTENRPLLSDLTPTPLSRELFRYTVNGAEPGGTYRWFGALTKPGTSTTIGEIAQAPFTIGP